jgi:hypothetical protein
MMVCVKCARVLRIERTGVYAEQLTEVNGQAYKVFSGDLYKCPTCEFQIIHTAQRPVAREHENEYFWFARQAMVKYAH